MKRVQSIVEIVPSERRREPVTPIRSRISFTDGDCSRPCSRLSSAGSSYKESHLWLNSSGEFQQHYNSIMDSTNLVDSCVEALNDISIDDGEPQWRQSHENIFLSNRLAREAGRNAAGAGEKGASLTDDQVESFERWLSGMEDQVAGYPTLSQIYAMEAKEMRHQLRVHSTTFNDIVAQPCIVKNSKIEKHKALEERYHLLYLRAYEVLLLLEGLPFDQTDNSAIIFNTDYDHEEPLYDDDVFHSHSEDIPHDNSKHADNGEDERQPIGLFTDLCDNNKDTAPTTLFDDDLLSLFDSSYDDISEPNDDRKYINKVSPKALHSAGESETASLDNSNTPMHVTNGITENETSYLDQSISMHEHNTITVNADVVFNKVQNWLNSRTINESTFQSDCRSNFMYIYKAKSELNMGAAPMNHMEKRLSSSTTSLHCVSPLNLSPRTPMDDNFVDPIDDELTWDHYEQSLEVLARPQFHHFELDGLDEYHMGEAEWSVCFFGEDYEPYVDPESISINSDEPLFEALSDGDQLSWISEGFSKISHEEARSDSTKMISDGEETDINDFRGFPATELATKTLKRRRRRNNRRVKKIRNQQISTPSLSSKASLMSGSNPSIDSEAEAPSTDSGKSIRYNSSEQTFEVFSDKGHEAEPIRHKVNELGPEDFYDIIKMCQNNIDCVITVLGAEPNRLLTVSYCQKMKMERHGIMPSIKKDGCHCGNQSGRELAVQNGVVPQDYNQFECCCRQSTCLCSRVTQTIAMIINFLIDCWNIFRNMRLYTYLGKILQGFFASTKEVAKHIRAQRELTRSLTYSC